MPKGPAAGPVRKVTSPSLTGGTAGAVWATAAIGKAANSSAADTLRTNHALMFVLCIRTLPRECFFQPMWLLW